MKFAAWKHWSERKCANVQRLQENPRGKRQGAEESRLAATSKFPPTCDLFCLRGLYTYIRSSFIRRRGQGDWEAGQLDDMGELRTLLSMTPPARFYSEPGASARE